MDYIGLLKGKDCHIRFTLKIPTGYKKLILKKERRRERKRE